MQTHTASYSLGLGIHQREHPRCRTPDIPRLDIKTQNRATRFLCFQIFENALIGLTQQYDKLVFEKKLSLRDQCAHWRGNPPVRKEMYRKAPKMGTPAILGGYRYLVSFNRGIATPVCGLVRNDSVFLVRIFKHQFAVLLG